jgi:hypothetical protein
MTKLNGYMQILSAKLPGDRRSRDRMVVGFTTTYMYVISVYHHSNCEFEPSSWRGVLDTTLCDNIWQ